MPDRVSFEKPPVVETVLGVNSTRSKGWGAQHLGLFWATVRDRLPKFEQHPPILSDFSAFPIQVQLGVLPPVRGWYLNDAETRIVQVQHDRFNYNWREAARARMLPFV